jgi:hypothetical protein
MDFRLPDIDKRLWKQQLWFEAEPSGSVTVKLKKGDKEDFESDTHSISLVNAEYDKVKKEITWDKTDNNFQVQVESTDHFSMHGLFSYIYPKQKKYR